MKVLLIIAALAGIAHATPKNTPAGKLNSEGIAAAKAKDWETARTKFAASYALDPDAGTLFNLANAQERTHHLAAAHDSYTRYLAVSRPGDDDTFRKTATAHLEKLDPQIGSIHLVTTFGPDVAFELDGAPMPRGADAYVDPGEHEVVAKRGGVVLGSKHHKISAGESADLELSPSLALDHDVKSTPPPNKQAPPPAHDDSHHFAILRSPWLWGAVAVVVVGASIGGYYEFSTKDPMRGTLDPGVIKGP